MYKTIKLVTVLGESATPTRPVVTLSYLVDALMPHLHIHSCFYSE